MPGLHIQHSRDLTTIYVPACLEKRVHGHVTGGDRGPIRPVEHLGSVIKLEDVTSERFISHWFARLIEVDAEVLVKERLYLRMFVATAYPGTAMFKHPKVK